MTLKREIKDAYIEGGNSIYVKTHSNAIYVDDNETETLTQRLDNVKDSITEHTSQLNDMTNEVEYIFPRNYGDIASGDFEIIKVKGKIIMVDCYTPFAWEKFKSDLINEGITHVDYLIITHYHGDHCGNFENLFNNNFIDGSTKIFLPPYSEYYMNLYSSVNDNYTAVKNVCDTNNLDYSTPYEGEVIDIKDFKLEIYNTNISYYESLTTNYNATSLIQLISHGNTKILLTGDAQPITLQYLLENLELPKLDLYKVEHHGINSDTYIPFLEKVRPEFSVQNFGLQDFATKSILTKSPTTVWLYNNNCINYGTGVSDKLVRFKSTIQDLVVVSGIPFFANKNSINTKIIYVDSNATNDYVQDGSQEKPFKNLAQALATIDKKDYIEVTIRIADGTYSGESSGVNISRVYKFGGSLTITGNVSDKSKVILNDGFDLRGCSNITIEGCTIYNNKANGIIIQGSNVFVDQVKITNSNGVISQNIGIFVKNANLVLRNSELNYSIMALQGKFSNIILNNVVFSNNTTNMKYEYCTYAFSDISDGGNNGTLMSSVSSQNTRLPSITGSVTSSYTTSTLNTETLPLTQSLISDNSCLSVENNAIKIKYGIRTAYVSAMILVERGQNTGDLITFSIRKNGVTIAEIRHKMSSSGNESIIIPPTFITITDGDEITLHIRSHNETGAYVNSESKLSNITLRACS